MIVQGSVSPGAPGAPRPIVLRPKAGRNWIWPPIDALWNQCETVPPFVVVFSFYSTRSTLSAIYPIHIYLKNFTGKYSHSEQRINKNTPYPK